jgi:hypothetical protein
MHEVVDVARRRQIGQPEFVAHLVDHGGQQVEVAMCGLRSETNRRSESATKVRAASIRTGFFGER